MSSRRLDNARINNFLKPWLDEKSSHYTFLNKITTTIVIDAAQKGTNANDLQSKLLRFCGDDNEKKKLSHFIKKYDKKID